jgi:hypothetical protein
VVVFTLETPITIGNSFTDQAVVNRLVITGVVYSSTPALAPGGTFTLKVTLTDPDTRRQFQIDYQDATASDVWADVGTDFATAVFNKLLADGKIPAGSVDSGATAGKGKTTQAGGVDTTQSAGLDIVGL